MAVATIKVISGQSVEWWSVVTFGVVADALLELDEGDAASFAGRLEATLYQSNAGETKINLKIVADKIIALSPRPPTKAAPSEDPTPARRRAPPKRRASGRPQSTPARDRPFIDPALNDEVPF